MKDKQFERLKSHIDKGMLRAIFLYGLLMFGMVLFVVNTFFLRMTDDVTTGFIVKSFVIWSMSGIFVGHLNWRLFIKMYNDELKKRNAKH